MKHENYNVKGLNKLSKQLHDFQIKAGFIDSNIAQRLMLVHSEISEAFEAFRKNNYAQKRYFKERMKNEPQKENIFFQELIKDTIEDEIADAIIRLLAFCGENNIDIEFHITEKMKYNELRGYKYGNKKF